VELCRAHSIVGLGAPLKKPVMFLQSPYVAVPLAADKIALSMTAMAQSSQGAPAPGFVRMGLVTWNEQYQSSKLHYFRVERKTRLPHLSAHEPTFHDSSWTTSTITNPCAGTVGPDFDRSLSSNSRSMSSGLSLPLPISNNVPTILRTM
jgi:hypothetical protein